MKGFIRKISIITLVLAVVVIFLSNTVSAQVLPMTGNAGAGNYTYAELGGTGTLTFTGNALDWITYENGDFWDSGGDDIWYMGQIIFGSLTNSSADPTNFGSTTMSVVNKDLSSNVYFTATVDSFDTDLTWMHLSNVTAGNVSSRFVDELLAVGLGTGNLQINSLTPGGGGSEDFIGNSSGGSSFIVAAPEPVSTVLFIIGGAVLALGRFRKNRI